MAPSLELKGKKGQQPSYLLLHLLHEVTKLINLQMYLVLENKLTQHEERRCRNVWSSAKYLGLSDREGQGHKPLAYKSHFPSLRQFYVETPPRILG